MTAASSLDINFMSSELEVKDDTGITEEDHKLLFHRILILQE